MMGQRYYSPELCRFIQPSDVSSLNPSSINGLNIYSYANNNPIEIAYSVSSAGRGTSINPYSINGINNNTQSLKIVLLPYIDSPRNPINIKPLSFSIGVVTPDNPHLPKWMDFSAFYISGHLGFGGGYGKAPGEKGSFGLSFASLDLGIISMKCDVITFKDDSSIYLGLGALNANGSLGLGFSGSIEVISLYFGYKVNDNFSIDGKVYYGWGLSFDFSNGIKVGFAAGVGFEISFNF